MNNKFLYDGELYDFDEIERRLQPDGFLIFYPGEVVRVVDDCEGNAKQFTGQLITAFVHSTGVDQTLGHWLTRKSSRESWRAIGGVCFGFHPKNNHSSAMPLACIKTKARQALERIGGAA